MNGARHTTNRKIITIFAAEFLMLLIFIFVAQKAQAATSTVRGIGWWGDNYKEVYFDCQDDKIGDHLDDPGNLYHLPLPYGFHFFANPCTYLQHHVSIDSNSNFSGQAWNPTKGLISFSGTSTPPDNYTSTTANCPNTCKASNSCWSCYNETQQKVYGWARVDTSGEWIQLDPATTTPTSIQTCNATSVLPGYTIAPGDFVGNASSTLSTLIFNCLNDPGSGNCTTRNYKVYISSLGIGNLSAPNWSYSQACMGTARGATLKWCTKSGTQSAYEIAVSPTNTLSTSTAVCWSGIQPYSAVRQYNLPNSDPTCGLLAYNTAYYWWIRLYDQTGTPTQWYQYFGNSASDTDGNIDNNALTFSTYKHEFPTPYFTWSPYSVLVGSSTIFNALTSRYFTTASPNSSVACSGSFCNYLWTNTDPGATTSASTLATTSIVFNLATGTTVSLKVTDNENYYCSSSTILSINYDLPIWREIKAK